VNSELLGAAVGGASVGSNHALCGTAVAVPGAIPLGTKYQPGTGNNVDFDTGDSITGWKCLKFSMSQAIYYKYSYTKGLSPVTSTHNGTPTVNAAESFEAAAEGDLDGDSAPSAFSLVGQQDGSNEMRLSTQVFIFDEFE
jgi:type IV pilus assembly protein PilA